MRPGGSLSGNGRVRTMSDARSRPTESDRGLRAGRAEAQPKEWTEPVLREHTVRDVANNCSPDNDGGFGGGVAGS